MLSYGHGERSVSNDMSKTCSLAKAKFDNLAESHDELAFRKGDVLTVVDQKMDGLDGWWLCSFRGKQGIVPANRVTLLAGMYYESALRFSASPDSSISDGGSVDYDIPRSDPQNRQLPPLPHQNAPARKNSSGPEGVARELLYDIPKSLEKTRIHADNVAMPASNSMPNIARKIQHAPEQFNDHVGNGNLYDTPNSSGQLLVNSAALMGRRSSGPISPICRSGDSAVDMTSNRSSMMSNTSSPPGSSVCDSEGNVDLYDTPNPLKSLNTVNRRQLLTHTHQKPSNKQPLSTELAYDVPKALQDSVLDYRDSGIYDNARLSTVHISPSNDSNLYDSPSSIAKPVHTTHPSAEQNKPIYDVLPSQAGRKEKILPKTMSSDSSSNLIANPLSINMNDIEKITLKLCEAIEIVVKLQQHVHTSATRLLSFVHTNWRVKSNLESVLYDLKLACVGLQSTLQEFYDFGIGALANAVDISDKTVMKRLSQTLFSLKSKLDVVNDSMKSLSAIKWHIAKLEQAAAQEAGGDHLMRLMAVAREVGEDVNRVASVIHGNSSLLFIASPDQALESPLPTTNSRSSLEPVQSKCLVREDSIDSYHEYDYCELTDRQDTPTNELIINIPPTQSNTFDHDQDCQYLRYYLKHVHSICDTVKIHITRMQDILVSESNQTIVSHSKLLLSTAHKLVYIGDTLCRSVRQASVQTAISDNANSLCNALKDFIMNTKEVALSQPSSRQAALNRLGHSVKAIELHTESFRYVISSQAN